MARKDPAATAGLVVIRLWLELPPDGAPDDLRARITTAHYPDLGTGKTFTVAGEEDVLMVVKAFLAELASASLDAGTPDLTSAAALPPTLEPDEG